MHCIGIGKRAEVLLVSLNCGPTRAQTKCASMLFKYCGTQHAVGFVCKRTRARSQRTPDDSCAEVARRRVKLYILRRAFVALAVVVAVFETIQLHMRTYTYLHFTTCTVCNTLLSYAFCAQISVRAVHK